jgi:hypothetical protein
MTWVRSPLLVSHLGFVFEKSSDEVVATGRVVGPATRTESDHPAVPTWNLAGGKEDALVGAVRSARRFHDDGSI